jgi:hypothetical protein
MRRRSRGTFGGRSGVWWRNRKSSIGSTIATSSSSSSSSHSVTSKSTAATEGLSLFDTTTTTTTTTTATNLSNNEELESLSSSLPGRDAFESLQGEGDDEDDTFTLLDPLPSALMGDTSSSTTNDYDISLAVEGKDVITVQTDHHIHHSSASMRLNGITTNLHGEDDANAMSSSSAEDDNKDDMSSKDPSTDEHDVSSTASNSPLWTKNRLKRQATFGGRVRWMVRRSATEVSRRIDKPNTRTTTGTGTTTQPPTTTTRTSTSTAISDNQLSSGTSMDTKKTSRRHTPAKRQKSMDMMYSPRTAKEINYYRTHFAQVDREIKLNLEYIQPPLAKRPRSVPPKKLNIV